MITVNTTLFVELLLFLVFFWVTRRYFLRPIVMVMERRAAKLAGDRAASKTNSLEADENDGIYAQRLADLRAESERRLRDARYAAYRDRRHEMEERTRQADLEILTYRTSLQKHLDSERARFAELLPPLIDAMDRQIRTGGSLF